MAPRSDRPAQDFLGEIVGVVDALVVVFDASRQLLYANPAAERLAGPGATRIFTAAQWQTVATALAGTDADATPLELETTLVDGEGTPHLISWRMRRPALADDTPPVLVCTGLDLTELRESEARYRWLSSATIEGITVHERGVIREVNDRCTAMWGYTAEEMIGRSVLDFATEASRPVILQRIQQGLEGPYEVVGLRKDGSTFPLEIVTRTTQYRGSPLRIAGLRDVSERQRLELERQQVEERVRQAQRMEAVGILAGGVAHDFNNLLSVIMGLTDIALDDASVAPQLHDDLERIQEAASLGAKLTRELLLFARPEPATDEAADVPGSILKVAGMLRRQVAEVHDVATELAEDLWGVAGRATQVEQILLNMCFNAIDAMPGGGTVTLAAHNVQLPGARPVTSGTLRAGDYVCLSVRDDGEGMDAATLGRIFEPFYSTRRPHGRSGLGLAVVYGLVCAAGGGIDVESRAGEGSRFDVYLPRSQKPAPIGARVHRPTARSSGRTIAVVEDQPDVLAVIMRLLERAGHQVLSAADGREAEALFAAHGGAIDLLISDVIMPGLSGPELVRRLAATYPQLRVLFISGYSDEALDAHDLGEATLLAKPFRTAELLARVEALLG